MSVTPELVKSKLASLDVTQESIVSVSSWLLFHRRAAQQIVDVWLQAVKDGSSNRKLSLMYLANEVAQQSRAKKRPEYPEAFSKVMPEAIEIIFRHATADVQQRISRVVDVWKTRSIFRPEVLIEVSKKLNTTKADSPRPVSTSLALPTNLSTIAAAYTNLLGLASSSSLNLGTANSLFSNLLESDVPSALSADLYKAKALQLTKSLDSAIVNIQESISVREDLIKQLQALVQENVTARLMEQKTVSELEEKRQVVRQATDAALLAASTQRSTTPEMDAPEVEALTPPVTLPDIISEFETAREMGPDAADPVSRVQWDADPTTADLLGSGDVATESKLESQAEGYQDDDEYVP